jgi:hypothetical protein
MKDGAVGNEGSAGAVRIDDRTAIGDVSGAVTLRAVDRRFLVDHDPIGIGFAAARADFDAGRTIRALEPVEELRHRARRVKPVVESMRRRDRGAKDQRGEEDSHLSRPFDCRD